MPQSTDSPERLNDPFFRGVEAALKRAAEKAQRQAREAGLEPIILRQERKGKRPEQTR